MSQFQDRDYLRQSQYRTSSHLTSRADLHSRFSISERDWLAWVLDRLALHPGEQVLECGSGPGWLWQSFNSVLGGCRLTLTDLSPGMVAEAADALSPLGKDIAVAVADIQALPFPNHSFDVVIANHMLYHVPNLTPAVAEVARVLRPGGRFLVATNGLGHMQELFDLGATLFPDAPLSLGMAMQTLPFALDNGTGLLAPAFELVELHHYASHLEVDDAEALIAYMLSSAESQAAVPSAARASAVAALQDRINSQGAIHIHKETGLFVAHPPRIAA